MEPQPTPKKLLDQVRDAVRLKHYSYRTEETYVDWVTRATSCFTTNATPTTWAR